MQNPQVVKLFCNGFQPPGRSLCDAQVRAEVDVTCYDCQIAFLISGVDTGAS
jgi:hypothetical protein